MIGTPPPSRDRFLCAIAERVPPDRVQAVFLFPPMRQGPVETCVAVLAVTPVAAVQQTDSERAVNENTFNEGFVYEASVNEVVVNEVVVNEVVVNEVVVDEVVVDEVVVDEVVVDEVVVDEVVVDEVVVDEVVVDLTTDDAAVVDARSSSVPTRPIVLTARYRHTIKGPDRGKWELEILEQADAPMITIETVVRGVQARLDDQAEPERLGADELRAALVEGVWTTPAR